MCEDMGLVSVGLRLWCGKVMCVVHNLKDKSEGETVVTTTLVVHTYIHLVDDQ